MINDNDLKTWCRLNQVSISSFDCSVSVMDKINYVFFSSLISLFVSKNKTATIGEVFAFLNDNSPKRIFSLIDDDIRTHLSSENIPYYIYDLNKDIAYEHSFMSIYNSSVFRNK